MPQVETPQTSGKGPDVVSQHIGETVMYGHSHTGIGALVLTAAAATKGGIGYLVRVIASSRW
jgi:hypothetical protein